MWTATLYDVDAKSFFLMAFDRDGIRVFRFGEAAPAFTRHLGVPEFPGPEAAALWRAWGGCIDGLRAEAFVPWSDVREIAAGNYVLWFRFDTPVTVTSDRGKTKRLREFKVALHGEMGTVEYHVRPGDDWWDAPSAHRHRHRPDVLSGPRAAGAGLGSRSGRPHPSTEAEARRRLVNLSRSAAGRRRPRLAGARERQAPHTTHADRHPAHAGAGRAGR